MRRLRAGVRRSRNRRQFSQVYLIRITGVSQVHRNLLATLSHVDNYAPGTGKSACRHLRASASIWVLAEMLYFVLASRCTRVHVQCVEK